MRPVAQMHMDLVASTVYQKRPFLRGLMPNGGSDCCGTCWFNNKNEGEAGYAHAKSSEPDYCVIRDTAINNPFYTYCANHPHRNPGKIEVPIGPVFTGDSSGQRQIWLHSPDNETIRNTLLSLLSKIKGEPQPEYPIGYHLELVVIQQLVDFGEKRALSELHRISGFDPNVRDKFGLPRTTVVSAAKRAIAHLERE
jgi:hypothetical protein